MEMVSSEMFASFQAAWRRWRNSEQPGFSEADVRTAESLVYAVCGSKVVVYTGPIAGLSVVVTGLGLLQRVFFDERGASAWAKAASAVLGEIGVDSFAGLEIWLDLRQPAKPERLA